MTDYFEKLKSDHESLIEEGHGKGSFEGMKEKIREFINTCADDGTYIWDPDDRHQIRSIISYWVSHLHSICEEDVSTLRLKRFMAGLPQGIAPIKIKPHWSDDEIAEAIKAGADLSGAYLMDRDLTKLDLTGRNLIRANLMHVKLDGVDLRRAILNGADLTAASLEEANLGCASLVEAKLLYAKLDGADLSRANLVNAKLMYANLAGADLSGANLSGAELGGAILDNATLNNTKFDGADMVNVRLSGVKGTKTSFRRVNLGYASLDSAELNEPIFEGARLGFASMREAKCLHGKFRGAEPHSVDLFMADFSGADLRAVHLKSSGNAETATWTDANVEGATLPIDLQLSGQVPAGESEEKFRVQSPTGEPLYLVRKKG